LRSFGRSRGRENGKLTQVDNWGRRQLAYPVAKIVARLRDVKYVGGGALVSEFERNCACSTDVLKYQTVLVRKDLDIGAVEVNTRT